MEGPPVPESQEVEVTRFLVAKAAENLIEVLRPERVGLSPAGIRSYCAPVDPRAIAEGMMGTPVDDPDAVASIANGIDALISGDPSQDGFIRFFADLKDTHGYRIAADLWREQEIRLSMNDFSLDANSALIFALGRARIMIFALRYEIARRPSNKEINEAMIAFILRRFLDFCPASTVDAKTLALLRGVAKVYRIAPQPKDADTAAAGRGEEWVRSIRELLPLFLVDPKKFVERLIDPKVLDRITH